MGVPLNILTQSQRFWYAQMVVAAILADEEITKPETDFIKQILPIIKKPEDRQELINRIASKSPPSIFRPPGVAPKVLAAVFIELALVMISDVDFADKERQFLENVADVFRFTDGYYKDLLEWCEEGLEWKNRQLEFVSSTGSAELLQVPVSKLNPHQQRWYAETLIASIMSDQQLDQAEVRFLKMAINLIKDDAHRREVTALVRQNRTPVLSKPQGFAKNYLVRIFIEVMLIISADESLDKKEHTFLQNLAMNCDFSDNLFNRLISWCVQGIKWKRAKNPLINKCQIKTPKSNDYLVIKGDDAENDGQDYAVQPDEDSGSENLERESLPEVEENPDNNSITNFNMDCYVCGSKLSVKFFQLKEKTQKPAHNIFGIPIYQFSADGFDPVDYNQCKVAVCHSCYFSSPQKEMFKLQNEDQPPNILKSNEFREKWLAIKDQNKESLKDFISELSTINRSNRAVVASYEMAVKASTMLADINNSHEIAWHTTTLMLILAQVLMENERPDEADNLLRQIQIRCIELFKTVKNRFITFRSGRLIVIISLYFGEKDTAANYYNFFSRFREKRFDSLRKEDQVLFQRVFGEIRRIMENPKAYEKLSLKGFLVP